MELYLFLGLLRPYRPRPEWANYVDLAWAAFAVIFLVVSFGAWLWRQHQQTKANKHAALNRVRARQRAP